MTTAAALYRNLDGASPDEIEVLRKQVEGSLITPGDPDYDVARQMVAITFDRYPAVILKAASTNDVMHGVRFARERKLPLAVRSGAHSVNGQSSVDGALVVDLGNMRRVVIDPVARTAVVQPGLTSNELGPMLAAYGLALTTGDTGSVGIGGLTVGGGIGWMVRKLGLTVDSLRAATVVTAAGDVIRASATEHPDLFWAIRGGGGNFGIITEFTFALHPHGNVIGGVVVIPATREVLRGYLQYTPEATEDLTTIAFLMHAPPAPFIPDGHVGDLVLLVGTVFTGAGAEADAALAPIRALGQPLADTVGSIPYPAMFAYTAEAEKRHGAAVRSFFTDDMTDDQLDQVIAHMERATSPFTMVQFRGLGGAMCRVPADATAFVHRNARIMFAILAIWFDPEDDGEAHRRWAADLWAEVSPASRGAYVNFLQEDMETRKRDAYFGDTYHRLQQVKATYDPENVFQFNVNIPPAR